MAEFHPLRSLEVDTLVDKDWLELNRRAEKLAKQVPKADLPSLDHLTMRDFDDVYEPSDDTYLMLDALQYDFQSGAFSAINDNPVVLEIGCGSGVNIAFLGALLSNCCVTATNDQQHPSKVKGTNPLLYVTDINPKALQVTKSTVLKNTSNSNHYLEAIQCDLASPMLQGWHAFVDILLFNPPYVPTPDEEIGGQGIEASWAGGEKGRRVVDRVISQIGHVLAHPHGVAYLITVDDNEPEELALLFSAVGLSMAPFLRRRAHNEFLSVQKLTWKR